VQAQELERKQDKARLDRVAALGCILCGRPAEIHHLRDGQGMAQRADDEEAIPLCPEHHRDGGRGTAIHAGRESFEARFGTERELLAEVNRRLEVKDIGSLLED